MNHARAKPGLAPRFRPTTALANKLPVKAETGCLSQRFAPSEKPKPSPEATVPPFSTRFHPPLRRTRRGRSQNWKKNPHPNNSRPINRLPTIRSLADPQPERLKCDPAGKLATWHSARPSPFQLRRSSISDAKTYPTPRRTAPRQPRESRTKRGCYPITSANSCQSRERHSTRKPPKSPTKSSSLSTCATHACEASSGLSTFPRLLSIP